MNPQEIVTLLKGAPFEPFAIYISDGSWYPVKHPDQVIVTPRAVHVGIGGNGRKGVVQEVVICALVHITRLGPIPKAKTRPRK